MSNLVVSSRAWRCRLSETSVSPLREKNSPLSVKHRKNRPSSSAPNMSIHMSISTNVCHKKNTTLPQNSKCGIVVSWTRLNRLKSVWDRTSGERRTTVILSYHAKVSHFGWKSQSRVPPYDWLYPSPGPAGSSSGSRSTSDYSGAASQNAKINKQSQRFWGPFVWPNKCLNSLLWLHFALTSSSCASFADQLENGVPPVRTPALVLLLHTCVRTHRIFHSCEHGKHIFFIGI